MHRARTTDVLIGSPVRDEAKQVKDVRHRDLGT
jgi:hypothetical protein